MKILRLNVSSVKIMVILLSISFSIVFSGCTKPFTARGPSGDIWTTYNAGYNYKMMAVQSSSDGRGNTSTQRTEHSQNKMPSSGTPLASNEVPECIDKTINSCRHFAKRRSN